MKLIKKVIRHNIIKWLLVILCMLGIFAMSHLDSVKSWYMTGKVLTTIEQTSDETEDLDFDEEIEYYSAQEDNMLVLRKLAHVLEFMILFLLMYNALYSPDRIKKSIYISAFLAVLYAVFDEVHQLFVVGRTGSIMDVVIDSLGVLIGIVIVMGIIKIGRRKLL